MYPRVVYKYQATLVLYPRVELPILQGMVLAIPQFLELIPLKHVFCHERLKEFMNCWSAALKKKNKENNLYVQS
jgi:hypothetical protein